MITSVFSVKNRSVTKPCYHCSHYQHFSSLYYSHPPAQPPDVLQRVSQGVAGFASTPSDGVQFQFENCCFKRGVHILERCFRYLLSTSCALDIRPYELFGIYIQVIWRRQNNFVRSLLYSFDNKKLQVLLDVCDNWTQEYRLQDSLIQKSVTQTKNFNQILLFKTLFWCFFEGVFEIIGVYHLFTAFWMCVLEKIVRSVCNDNKSTLYRLSCNNPLFAFLEFRVRREI